MLPLHLRSASGTMSRFCCMLFLFLCVLQSARFMSLLCPNVEDVKPCTCKRVSYGLHIMCANVNSSDTLKMTFSILREYNVHNVLLHGIYLSEPAPHNLFAGMKVKELRIEKSHLQFSEPAFTGLDGSLTMLTLSENSLAKTEREFDFAPLTHLTKLDIQSNRITRVSDGWLGSRVPNVQKLVLDKNEISNVGGGAFADLKHLKEVSLYDNRIEAVSRSMFPRPAMALTRIDFSHNQLHSVPSDIFIDMPSLHEVVLSGNEIKTLPEQTWIDIWGRLDQVLLYENSLVCDEKLQWIKSLKPPSRLEGTCSAPSEMKGKSIKDIFDT